MLIVLPTFHIRKVLPSLQPYIPYREGKADFRRVANTLQSPVSIIDSNGDHVLGCDHGQRQGALRDILRHEQGIYGNSLERLSDTFHPDYTDSRPNYVLLDVSINTTEIFRLVEGVKASNSYPLFYSSVVTSENPSPQPTWKTLYPTWIMSNTRAVAHTLL